MEVRQLCRELRNREHCPVELRALFKEISERVENQHNLEGMNNKQKGKLILKLK